MHSPLLWMTLTLVAYQAGFWLHRRLGEPLLMPPLLWSLIILITVVVVGKVDYQTYFQANAFIHFLLGTSTVALAVPLYQSLPRMKTAAIPLTITLIVGSLLGAGVALALASMAQLSPSGLSHCNYFGFN